MELSSAQETAVRAPIDRPLLILAAAGSGKTLVLCHRILHILSFGVLPKDILAVTFTRRAGQDLLCRLQQIANTLHPEKKFSLEGVRVCTFHSFCLAVLRASPTSVGLAPGFTIFTPKMQIDLLEQLVQRWYIEELGERKLQALKCPNQASERNRFRENTDAITQQEKHIMPEQKRLFRIEAHRLYHKLRCGFQNAERIKAGVHCTDAYGILEWVYGEYTKHLKNANGIDFNGFSRNARKVLEECPEVIRDAGLHAQYVLVDEFQDTDSDQFELLGSLCKDKKWITVVGDDDQQIYSWRGASGLSNFSKFGVIFPDGTMVKLERNYRSTGAIVAVARCVIAKNASRIPKTIRTISPTGASLAVCECRNELCEVVAVEDFIKHVQKEGVPLSEIAVLYRLQRVGLELQQKLRARNIHCHMRGAGFGIGETHLGNSFDGDYGLFHSILAVLQLVICESNDLACKSLMDLFCPIVGSTVSKCLKHLQHKQGIPLLRALKITRSHLLGLANCEKLILLYQSLDASDLSVTDRDVLERIHRLLQIVEMTGEDAKTLGLRDVIMNLMQQLVPAEKHKTNDCVVEKSLKVWDINHVTRDAALSCTRTASHYKGIKVLLSEADLFDTKRTHIDTKADARGTSFCSYKELMQQRERRILLLSNYKSSINNSSRFHDANLGRLRDFLDLVILKLHNGELGDCMNSPNTELKDNGTASATVSNSINLCTIHQAKGLEWTAIILVRANEGVLPMGDYEKPETNGMRDPQVIDSGYLDCTKPSGKPANSDRTNCVSERVDLSLLRNINSMTSSWASTGLEALEEERRLMYVALTRAKRYAMITHVMLDSGQQTLPSRFLTEIPPGLVRKSIRYESVQSGKKLAEVSTLESLQLLGGASKTQNGDIENSELTEMRERDLHSLNCNSMKCKSTSIASSSCDLSKKRRRSVQSCNSEQINGIDSKRVMEELDNTCHSEVTESHVSCASFEIPQQRKVGVTKKGELEDKENIVCSNQSFSEHSDSESPIKFRRKNLRLSVNSSRERMNITVRIEKG